MASTKSTSVSFESFNNIVNGEPRSSKSTYNGIDPTTMKDLWDVPVATKDDIEDAVTAANKAFTSWSKTKWEDRVRMLGKFRDLLLSHDKEFQKLLMRETGKPTFLTSMEVSGMTRLFDWHESLKPLVEVFEDDTKVITTRYVPLGVVAAICPWNFPITLSLGKIIPALLTGNCIIVKPSPFTPYTALKIVEIAQQIFPPGVVQVLGGDDTLGPQLVAHPNIHKISFTGSVATGKKVMQAAAPTLKRVTLELGGNDATIVLPDVDVAAVAPQVVLGSFGNSGQICVAVKRIYVHESIYEPFVKAMVEFTKTLKVGDPNEEDGVMVGPIQNKMQYDRVKGFFEDSKKNGYKFAVGPTDVATSKGYFVQPTIIDNPPNDSRIISEEPFGPIVPCQPYTDLDEVIARANHTNTGLGACVWGSNVDKAEEVAMQLQAGSVFVNSYEKPSPEAVFGGVKESGIGGEWGTKGYLAYCNPHVMHTYKTVKAGTKAQGP
ncbi:MAG: hypothetical protein Q9227_000541 [Pyrenula ochraceoflavens]